MTREVRSARGHVKQWSDDEGWGVIASPEVPGEVWAHFIHLAGQAGFRSVKPGEAVEFDYIEMPGGGQDNYSFRTESVRML